MQIDLEEIIDGNIDLKFKNYLLRITTHIIHLKKIAYHKNMSNPKGQELAPVVKVFISK